LYKRDYVVFDLIELAHEKLGISRSYIYPSSIKQKLNPALKEHKAKNLLSSAVYTKSKSGEWLLRVEKYKEPGEPDRPPDPPSTDRPEDRPSPRPQGDPCTKTPPRSAGDQREDPLIQELVTLGVSVKVAQDLLNSYPAETIRGQLAALPHRRNIEDRAAFLVQAIRENFPLPQGYTKKKARAAEESEDKLKAKYYKYIMGRVEEHLKGMDPEALAREIKEHKPVYLSKVPAYFQENLSQEYLDKENERDYRKDKAKELNLPSFEQWQNRSVN